jgi:Reverse transcriptase (RNA-dependent DNA polymerase)/RNase H-like domain found in reverse transcriptase
MYETQTQTPKSYLDICMIGAAPFNLLVKKKDHELFSVTLKDVERALQIKKNPSAEDIKKKLPADYHEYVDVFSRDLAETLPPHRPGIDHSIPLQTGTSPPFGPMYPMSRDELEVLHRYLKDNLKNSFISPSSSPAASPVLFVKKPGGGLRFCVDYRGLNTVTIKNRYPIPLLQETLHRLSRAKFFTKLDVIAAFNRIRIAPGEEWKTAFRTRYGLFQYNVMPFGLSNAPSSFQNYINDTLKEYLDEFCTAYLDDILIYSDTYREHQDHVRRVLQRLRMSGLQIDIEKCEFNVTRVKYLGLIVSTEGIQMDAEKVQAILDWETPTKQRDVQSFIGFANFYRRFIRDFSIIAGPIIKRMGQDFKKSIQWDTDCEQAFRKLKAAFVSVPILKHFDPFLEIILETDVSDFVSVGVLSQYHDDVLHPVAFFSKRHSPVECNYEIYDKELLVIIRAFKQWRPELEGAPLLIQVITNHRNLQYYISTKKLLRR